MHGMRTFKLNGQLKKYPEIIRYTFVDMYTPLLDQQNSLHTVYTTDGVHLNPTGLSGFA